MVVLTPFSFTGDPLLWHPRLHNGSTFLYLPQPVLTFQPSLDWKSAKFDVPLADGTIISGVSVRGPSLTIVGQTAARQTTSTPAAVVPKIDEDDQMAVLAEMIAFLRNVPANGFTVYDFDSSNYSGAYPQHFDYDTGDGVAKTNGPFPYTIRFDIRTPTLNA